MSRSPWLLLVAPFVVYPVLVMQILCFALFACAFNLLLGFTGLLSFGHAAFLGAGAYTAGYVLLHWGFTPELGLLAGDCGRRAARSAVRRARDSQARHLLRDDHAGARADGVLLLPAGALHRRRGWFARHPARQAVRPAEFAGRRRRARLRALLRRGGHLRRRLLARLSHRSLAVRSGVESDSRERAARALARLRRRPLQAARVRAVGRAGGSGGRDQSAGARALRP